MDTRQWKKFCKTAQCGLPFWYACPVTEPGTHTDALKVAEKSMKGRNGDILTQVQEGKMLLWLKKQSFSLSSSPSSFPLVRDILDSKAEADVIVCLAHSSLTCCTVVIMALLVVKNHMATAYFHFFLPVLWQGCLAGTWWGQMGQQPPELPWLNSHHPMTVITDGIHGLRSLRSSEYSAQDAADYFSISSFWRSSICVATRYKLLAFQNCVI